ncbi:DEAD/DEAH box helicase [Megasphaera hutchinsoni]|uniref:Helicase protein n=1 Tax=Megasphaera hutchinsoni TaxID=1588748 RepID=A0A134CL04_9FIRM|nr:DEAD/DEAH box helicase [Megasphaera hutchinsoni]KXB92817.1 helicase protein [Megasphaera hutchinsoni]MUP48327.1 helicase [Veillonellaceae bacterium M2-8]
MNDSVKFNADYLKDFEYNWNCTKYYSSVIDTTEARKFLINVLENWDKVNNEAKLIWLDLVERAGFYPYYIDKIKNIENYNQSLQSSIRSTFFKSEYLNGVYFHEKQKEIEIAINLKKNVAVSAPTSFGKSLFIEEFVARKQYNNILIIQPTLALIDETRKNMYKYLDYYNIVINTKQKATDRNIFILTAERVLEYEAMPKIDFFIVDEFYKVSNLRNDDRVDALNISIMKIMNDKPQSLFLTPSVNSLSDKFIKIYDVEFFKTDYSLVNTNIIEVRKNNKPFKSKEKKQELFKLLKELKEPSIVYVKSPNEAYKLANEYIDYLKNVDVVNRNLPIFEWMDENISEKWDLKKLMKYGIGAHNGALPRHIVSSEIEMFNEGILQILFATVSLIEGVNTVAKNILIFSNKKGVRVIDFFDFANIKGRAGRMGKYYTGNVYLFNEQLLPEDFSIDVPFIDQNDISNEILFNIPDDYVEDRNRKKSLVSGIPEELQTIIRKNLISVEGQKKLYNYIKSNVNNLSYLKWSKIPSFEDLWKTLNLAYKFLENNNNEKFAKLQALMSLDIVNRPLKEVIYTRGEYIKKTDSNKNFHEKAIEDVLKFVRNDANYKIPKLLSVVESIQRYVFENIHNGISGDYSIFSSLLENGEISENFRFLVDYGVPLSAVKKIEVEFNKCNKENYDNIFILQWLKQNINIFNSILLEYEYNLLKKSLNF